MAANAPAQTPPAEAPAPAPPAQPPSAITATRAVDPMPERDTTLNLDQRMLSVMHAIGYIPKHGTGPESQGSYKFAEVSAIKDRVRDECIRAGIMVHVSMDGRDVQVLAGTTREGNARTSILATVWGTLLFVNVDHPDDDRLVTIHGQGIDTQDKAISKATTSAVKYGLLNAFTIPTGDDPDASGEDIPNTGQGVHQGARSGGRTQQPARGPGPGQYRPPQTAQQPQGQPAVDADGVPFPDAPNGGAPVGQPGDPGRCPVHNKPWRSGARGYFCATKVGQDSWCQEHPPKSWSARQER